MIFRSALFLVLVATIATVMSSPTKQCQTLCTTDTQCCEPGGCYLNVCTSCRISGQTCQRDSQCCAAGGCYVNKCMSCRTLGMTCQASSQCCSGICGALGHCV
ncbi:uncharacterized protein SJCHGC06055 [Folsomia candida]|nr:uncharacterized protein SJCHGC06055 [Folsomia candida]